MKTCTECGEEKPIEGFHIDRGQSDHRKTKCRLCTNKVKAQWREANREKVLSQKKASYEKNREHYLEYMRSDERRKNWFRWKLKKHFGITPEDFDRMMQEQGGSCAICGSPPRKIFSHHNKHRLHVDHDHTTGVVRGLLCNNCNAGIGFFRDNPKLLREAIKYLRNRGGF